LAAQQAALKAASQARVLHPFTLQLGRLNSFDSAAFLQVTDPEGGLQRLREVLVGTHDEYRDMPYCPHLTVGLYRRAVAKTALTAQLLALDAGPALSLPVQAVSFVHYEARCLQGPLTTQWVWPLRGLDAEPEPSDLSVGR
jgi:2'-5' RNA ligase